MKSKGHYMNQFEEGVALIETVAQKVERRNKQAAIIQQIIALSKQLEISTYELSQKLRNPEYISESDVEHLRQVMDNEFWREMLEQLQVEKFTTTTDKEKLYDQFSEKCPVFDEKNVNDLMAGFMASKDSSATNMIKKIYKEVTDCVFRVGNKYKSNNEKRIQREIPMSFRASVFSSYSGDYPSHISSGTYNNFNLIDDLERACYLVDGKTQPDRSKNIHALTDAALREKRYTVEGPYFDLQIFKNGNVKVTFTSQQVVATLNKWGRTGNQLDT